MKVLLISANTETINMPTFPLGLASVAQAAINQGHEIAWLDLMDEKDPEGSIKAVVDSFAPELIGVSIRNIDDQNMENPRFLLDNARECVQFCRDVSKAPIVVGGAGYSIFPDSALDYLGADMGIQGEGEGVFPDLLELVDNGLALSGLPGLYMRGKGLQADRGFEKDLDNFPLPDPTLFSTAAYEGEDFFVPVQTRRGCPMACSYCSTATVEGGCFRRRSPESIVNGLKCWAENGHKRFQFVDNVFNLPPMYTETLCAEILKAGPDFNWRCILYPGHLQAGTISAMSKAGCEEVSLGFESGCDDILKMMNKQFMSKDVYESVRMLSDCGIKVMGFLLLGGPGETRHTVMKTLDFIRDLPLSSLKVTIGIRIYPHTKLAESAYHEGLIKANDTLLFPRFYMAKGLDGWLRETIDKETKEHSNWIV